MENELFRAYYSPFDVPGYQDMTKAPPPDFSFTTFFRISKYEKFIEFTHLDSLNLIKWGKVWKKWILPLLHLRKVNLVAKILNMALPRKLFHS